MPNGTIRSIPTFDSNYIKKLAKLETKVKVALEGIITTGIPVVKNTYYTIKK